MWPHLSEQSILTWHETARRLFKFRRACITTPTRSQPDPRPRHINRPSRIVFPSCGPKSSRVIIGSARAFVRVNYIRTGTEIQKYQDENRRAGDEAVNLCDRRTRRLSIRRRSARAGRGRTSIQTNKDKRAHKALSLFVESQYHFRDTLPAMFELAVSFSMFRRRDSLLLLLRTAVELATHVDRVSSDRWKDKVSRGEEEQVVTFKTLIELITPTQPCEMQARLRSGGDCGCLCSHKLRPRRCGAFYAQEHKFLLFGVALILLHKLKVVTKSVLYKQC
ncbi:hypothetical protein EVAR_9486_1 [Eumeta japonica]|uniref:Uncharacterized protein n=1 Tax=Eumeta variegata TaxID=151549 RepID=A0A4C2A5C9_EUMVA|nr:hypothetical protein EVAR_9486_1 [Eumeta japonica]